jgi:HTH-type transcriptional regulator / antitoxin HigA
MIEVIKSPAHYDEVLARVAELASRDPVPDSDEGRELELLALLLKDYEQREFPLAAPSPVAAIRLRLEQLELAPKDLIPYLGSRSRVSEVLSGKRPLSIAMIRALNTELGIPLESLVSEEIDQGPTENIEWDRFPVRELISRKWIDAGEQQKRSRRLSFSDAQSWMEEFFRPVGGPRMALGVLQKTDHLRTSRNTDRYALAAWAAYVRKRADLVKAHGEFRTDQWGPERLRELRSLSRYDVGPRLAVQFLLERGIVVIIAEHLKRTRLDGAAMLLADGTPVIGLTLRHDRLDNFWFTLFHELMHVLLHLTGNTFKPDSSSCYFDDLDITTVSSPVEEQADQEAREALVPWREWEASAVRYAIAPATVSQLALKIGVGEAIVAGRVRHERRNFRLLSSMVGAGEVRPLFRDMMSPPEAA